MIRVTSQVKMNGPAIDRMDGAALEALLKTAEALHTEVGQAQVVPRMDGALGGEQFFVDESELASGAVYLVHQTPYARRLYFHPEYRFHKEPWVDEKGRKHDGAPNAQGKWFKQWLPGGAQESFIQETYERMLKELIE